MFQFYNLSQANRKTAMKHNAPTTTLEILLVASLTHHPFIWISYTYEDETVDISNFAEGVDDYIRLDDQELT